MATANGTGRAERTASGKEPRSNENRRVRVMGVAIDDVDEQEAVAFLMASLSRRQGGWVFTPNVDIVRQVVADERLLRLAEDADLVIPDGMPLVWASRLQGTPLRARVAGSHLVYPLCQRAAEHGYSVFLLGSTDTVSAGAAAALVAAAPGLCVAGRCSPPHGFENSPSETAAVVEALEKTAPDIVICAFGFPKQERLMAVLRRLFPSTWFLGAGGTLTIAAGVTPAAPQWMRRTGFEWLHRLRLEPRRLFRRYVIDDIPFAFRLLLASAGARGAASGRRESVSVSDLVSAPDGGSAPDGVLSVERESVVSRGTR